MKTLLILVASFSVAHAEEVIRRGAAVSPVSATPLAEVIKAPEKYSDKTVVVEGKVRAACNKKGCWMELAPSLDAKAAGCRVTFKDYGFFVPVDAKGATARVEGAVSVRVLNEGQVEHLEGEGGRPNKAPDGTAKEIRIVATGVELRR